MTQDNENDLKGFTKNVTIPLPFSQYQLYKSLQAQGITGMKMLCDGMIVNSNNLATTKPSTLVV